MDVYGEIVMDVWKWLPYWALELARLYRNRGELDFIFQLNAWTFVKIYWPDEETQENWYY